MNDAALAWIAVFAGSALLFFGIAAVAGVRGLGDLRDLLRGARRRDGGTIDGRQDRDQGENDA